MFPIHGHVRTTRANVRTDRFTVSSHHHLSLIVLLVVIFLLQTRSYISCLFSLTNRVCLVDHACVVVGVRTKEAGKNSPPTTSIWRAHGRIRLSTITCIGKGKGLHDRESRKLKGVVRTSSSSRFQNGMQVSCRAYATRARAG
jgi:hypothetical protein